MYTAQFDTNGILTAKYIYILFFPYLWYKSIWKLKYISSRSTVSALGIISLF